MIHPGSYDSSSAAKPSCTNVSLAAPAAAGSIPTATAVSCSSGELPTDLQTVAGRVDRLHERLADVALTMIDADMATLKAAPSQRKSEPLRQLPTIDQVPPDQVGWMP